MPIHQILNDALSLIQMRFILFILSLFPFAHSPEDEVPHRVFFEVEAIFFLRRFFRIFFCQPGSLGNDALGALAALEIVIFE